MIRILQFWFGFGLRNQSYDLGPRFYVSNKEIRKYEREQVGNESEAKSEGSQSVGFGRAQPPAVDAEELCVKLQAFWADKKSLLL